MTATSSESLSRGVRALRCLLISHQVLRQGFLRAGAARQRPSTPSARLGFTRPHGPQLANTRGPAAPAAPSQSGRPPCGPREVGVRARGDTAMGVGASAGKATHGGGGQPLRAGHGKAKLPVCLPVQLICPQEAGPCGGKRGCHLCTCGSGSPPGREGADSSCFGPCQDSWPNKREEVIPDFPLSPPALGLNPCSSTHSGSRGWTPDRAKPQHVVSVNWGEMQTSQAGCRGFSGGDCTPREWLAQAHQHSCL